jgi:hypothetical protein
MPSLECGALPTAAPSASLEVEAPPCFFWPVCLHRAAVEKAGRSVCCNCASQLRGVEYPLRNPLLEPIYLTGHAAAEALDMIEK